MLTTIARPGHAAGDAIQALLRASAQSLRAGDAEGAERMARAVLAQRPEQPEALRILGRCAYDRGRTSESLALVLQAARSMQTQELDPAGTYLVWSDLNFMFSGALAGLDSAFASQRRADYAHRPVVAQPADHDASVTVVVVVGPDGAGTARTLQSVALQTCRDVDIVVVYAGDDPRSHPDVAAAASACAFPVRWLAVPGASDVELANAGVRDATGTMINVLFSPHRLASSRVSTMRTALVEHGVAWGFSDVAFTDIGGFPVIPERDWQVRAWSERLRAVAEADTIGYTLIHQDFVAVDAGNLFFRRTLFDDVGGFRPLDGVWAWDFGLRAVLRDEPVFVPSPEYVRVVTVPVGSAPPRRPEEEAAQIAMFADFYAVACGDTAVPNSFAPCMASWRAHFLKTVFHTGHVLALPLAELERLGKIIIERSTAVDAIALQPGLDLIGFAFGEFGLGENLRAFARACVQGDIPFGIKDVDMRLKTRQADRTMAAHIADALRHRCSVFCLNPDMMRPVRNLVVTGADEGRYCIGYWFWELEQIPRQWDYAIADVDEIWVATEFIAAAMRAATTKPVVKIPTPIDVVLARPYARAEFGLPDDRFLFLFSFDFNSFSARKNPEGTITAFKRAFAPGRRDVGLVIKSINGLNKPEKMREMRALIGDDDRIVITDGFLSRDQVSGLHAVVDAYVSLHRAEGLGLGLAESMYLGKPVIGTRYSGNLEFMDENNSCLVDCTLVPVKKGEYLYDDERFRWADPDVDHAARHMRRLVDDEAYRKRIAAQGRRDIRTRFTHASAAALMRKRLRELGLL